MVFSSNVFLFVFLPVVMLVYYLIDSKFKNIFLLLASLFFYFWGEPIFVLIMLASITINYVFGLVIHYTKIHNLKLIIKRIVIFSGIIANLGLLFYFKYLDFSIEIANKLFHSNLALRNIALPIGISFFTFQGMTYIIDLYWDKVPVQKNPLKVALYISLFPQLIAGPIVRYIDINEQIDKRTVDIEKYRNGLERFTIGLAKKIIIANTVALIADNVFSVPYIELSITTAWLGIICYSLQIYFDFSGYSDMAIGLGKMFGFDFLENFNYPYIAKSITEFWRRWHISLSTFFRDYVYIPLGGNRKGNVYINLSIVFVLTGLWHGASMNFVIWGVWHGLFMLIERILKSKQLEIFKIPNIIKRLYTLIVVLISWVFFRSDTLEYATGYLGIMFGINKPQNVGFSTMYYLDAFSIFIIIIAIIASTGILPNVINNKMSKKPDFLAFNIAKMVYYTILILVCAAFVMTSTYNPFIYFRF